jgi:hypothetical protein
MAGRNVFDMAPTSPAEGGVGVFDEFEHYRLNTGVDLHFKLGLGQFLEKRYTSIETFAA